MRWKILRAGGSETKILKNWPSFFFFFPQSELGFCIDIIVASSVKLAINHSNGDGVVPALSI